MMLTIRILGLELLHIEATTDPPQDTDPGEYTTYPVGFTPTPRDQRWQPGAEIT